MSLRLCINIVYIYISYLARYSHDYKIAQITLGLHHACWHQLHELVEEKSSTILLLRTVFCARTLRARR